VQVWSEALDNFALLGFTILGISVLVHVIIVNITIGTGWISAIARFLAWRRRAAQLEIMSRRVFKILIIHELFAGVWGTIITVILAAFFPTLMATATDVIFYPILIALSAILIRIPSIALFWYTWGKVRASVHSLIGFVMALSGFGVPLGFRYIFAEITYPYGLGFALQGLRDLARVAVFSNPLYPSLLLHTWMGAMSIGGFIVASFFTIKGNVNPKFAWIGLWHGVLFLGAQVFAGPLYLYSLGLLAPVLFDNILGLVGSTFNILLVFVTLMILVVSLGIVSARVWRRLKRGEGTVPRYAIVLGPLAVVIAMIMEFMNDAGRYPYLVLTGATGIGPETFMNYYVSIPPYIIYAVVGALVAFVGVFMLVAYYALNRRFLADLPEEIATWTIQREW
jgi:cytochrome d ubiquinol oxidase subunit I